MLEGWKILRTITLSLLFLAGCGTAPEVLIDNARVRALIPGQDKTVAYMDVQNRTASAITMAGTSSATM